MAAVKKINRSNKTQIAYLCNYMNSHSHFAAGDFKTPHGAAQYERQWTQLKAALDELGPTRTVEQWKICWRDQKRKARVEGGAQNKILNATGNQGDVPELSQNSVLILSTIGEEMALGTGPEESPVGFSGHNVPPPPLAPGPSVSPTLNQSRASLDPPAQASYSPATAPTITIQTSEQRPLAQHSSAPGGPTRAPARPKRNRKIHPPDRFIAAQLEMNALLKDLIKEVRRGNILKQEHNRLLRGRRSKK